ncbi:MAG TPA: glycine/sarcosine/betaine reductase complex component C subunit beta [Clostridia bacterium]|nr:glycine/sarcosine/betaine reductase complex component C subunit beta [Clostridia bacterium]
MNSVIKATGYVLVHSPDMLVHNGTTQTTERANNAESEYLRQLPQYLRSYQEAVAYLPNQTYIGNLTPEALAAVEQPWYDKPMANAQRFGTFGEIMPQDEFLLLLQASDVFDLVRLSSHFVSAVKPRLSTHPLIGEDILSKIKDGVEPESIEKAVNAEHAEPLYHDGALVGYVRRAHDFDPNLSAHTMLENLVSKASSVLALLHLVQQAKIEKSAVSYVIDCSEEACGDMNQRGGGNFAKAAAEIAGLTNATGCDIRAFCAAPAHAIILAASMVTAGVYENVVVTAGGCTAKLGMNGKDHVKKGIPLLEDVLGGFAVLVSKNDGVSPEIDTNLCGRHTVGTGSSPQNVITSLVTDPLDRAGLRITDIDKFSVEMQNPDVTKPAGAGDVPLANYKMIAALAVKRNEIERDAIGAFVERHGMVGWAPTQGHIPSGVPYLGFARQEILAGKVQRAMIIGKGSLFLGRMTNLFDGVSFVIRKNSGAQEENTVTQKQIQGMIAKAMREFAENLMREQR